MTAECPFCGFEVGDDDIRAQGAHLAAEHPDAIPDRLRAAGFEQRPDGTWVDILASDE